MGSGVHSTEGLAAGWVLAGAVAIDEFFAPRNLRRLIGLRGFARIAGSKLRRAAA